MQSFSGFLSAILLLLVVPGPTNTLLFMSGASAGLLRSTRLLVAEAAGYMSVVLPVAVLAAPLLDGRPEIAAAMKCVAAVWVLHMAFRLWTRGPRSPSGVISLPTMYVTTLLNPKALIVGLVLMPHGSAAQVAPWAAVFLAALVVVALCWISAGALTRFVASGRSVLPSLCRVAAACLAVFSGVMIHSASAALV